MSTETKTRRELSTGGKGPTCDFCYGPLGRPYANIRVTDPNAPMYGHDMKMCKECCKKWNIPIHLF